VPQIWHLVDTVYKGFYLLTYLFTYLLTYSVPVTARLLVYNDTYIVCVQCLTQLVAHRIFTKSVHLLSDEQCTKIIFNALEGNYALCLLGQFIFFLPMFHVAW